MRKIHIPDPAVIVDGSRQIIRKLFSTESIPAAGFTGSRQDWIRLADTLLEPLFVNISSVSKPVRIPRTDHTHTYPGRNASAEELQAERFEALARTFLIASPLLCADPDRTIHGISLRAYYSEQIRRACDPEDELCVGTYPGLRRKLPETTVFQQTVEAGLLAAGLWISRDILWEQYADQEKEKILSFLEGYALGNTVPHNWMLFNMIILAFLSYAGKEIDRGYMQTLADTVLDLYAGDGWYRDGMKTDYYSCWGFQFFLPLWNLMYGYAQMPDEASEAERNLRALVQHLPYMFAEDGTMVMWGRSVIYRAAAAVPLLMELMMNSSIQDPVFVRKTVSGVIGMFVRRAGALTGGILNPGFYHEFIPAVQSYSCSASPYWMGMIFICLMFPEDHPFWREKEIPVQKTGTFVSDHAGIAADRKDGGVWLRTGNVLCRRDDLQSINAYCALAYHSDLPWMDEEGHPAMQYICTGKNRKAERVNRLDWQGYRNGILQRQAWFAFTEKKEQHWINRVDLREICTEHGILRIDMPKMTTDGCVIELTGFACPQRDLTVQTVTDGQNTACVIHGTGFDGMPYSAAFCMLGGWQEVKIIHYRETNAMGEKTMSAVFRASPPVYYRTKTYLISQMLYCRGDHIFTEDELFPISKLETGRYTHIVLKNGEEYTLSK